MLMFLIECFDAIFRAYFLSFYLKLFLNFILLLLNDWIDFVKKYFFNAIFINNFSVYDSSWGIYCEKNL